MKFICELLLGKRSFSPSIDNIYIYTIIEKARNKFSQDRITFLQ